MTISQWDQVPEFAGEAEEASFWEDAKLDVRLMESSILAGQTAKESVTITLRMDPRMLSRVKYLARSRFLTYQSMIKQWLSERLVEEHNKLKR